LEMLFPGLTQGLVDQGTPQGLGRLHFGGGYFHPPEDAPELLFASRPALETAVRARLLTLATVRILENCDALGLTTNPDCSRVTGVRLLDRQTGGGEAVLSADLVVDASGRGSHSPAWLENMGYARPAVDLVEVKIGYASRVYQRQADHLDGDPMIFVMPTVNNKRGCGVMAQEGERWMVTLAGYFGDHPPTDEAGFLQFAQSLPTPEVYDLIRTATPLSDLVAFKFPANRRRRYEALDRFPAGFLVIGDAVCSFNPIYGQGMTVAALEALALRECLADGLDQLAQRFFKRAGKIVEEAWRTVIPTDLGLSESETVPPSIRFINWYASKLQIAARRDPVAGLAYIKVGNLMAAPSSMLHPYIVLRVLWGNLLHR